MSKLDYAVAAFMVAFCAFCLVFVSVMVATAITEMTDQLRERPSCESIFGSRLDAHGTQADYDAAVMAVILARGCKP
jgi:hypothetical protein